LKTDSGYPKDTGVTLFTLTTPGNPGPFAIPPIGQLPFFLSFCRLFFFLSFFFLRRTLSFFLSFFLSFTELVKSQIHGIQIHERLLALDWNPAAGTFVSSGVRLCHGMYVCYFVVSNRYLTLKGPWVAMDEPRMSQGLRTHHVSSPTYDFELSTLKKLEFKAVSQMVLTLRLIEFTFHRVTVLFCYRLSHRQ